MLQKMKAGDCMGIYYLVLVVIAGLVFGSFLNVCIYRIPRKESVVFGRSHCTNCGSTLAPFDMIPVFSFLILKGRCRQCKSRISPVYPVVEALNALIYVLIYLNYGLSAELILYSAFASVLIIISFIDIKTRTIPDVLVLFIFIIGILSCFFSRQFQLYERIVGVFISSIPLLVAAMFSKGGMGGGDIKLMAASGLLIGYKLSLFSLFAASIVCSIFGLIYIAIKHKSIKTTLPFGPFLSGAMFLSLLCGNQLIYWYFTTFLK